MNCFVVKFIELTLIYDDKCSYVGSFEKKVLSLLYKRTQYLSLKAAPAIAFT